MHEQTESLWARLERGELGDAALQSAHDAELRLDLETARSSLAEARTAEHGAVCDVLELRLAARTATGNQLVEVLERAEALLNGTDQPTCGRLHLLRGSMLSRLNRLNEAELALFEALTTIEAEAPARIWALDAFGTVLTGQGAYEEARRLLRHVIAAKRAMDDALGVAISVGNLGRLELRGGSASAAHELLTSTLKAYGQRLEPLTLLRLETACVEVALDAGNSERLALAVAALQARLAALGETRHHLVGFAEITLARAATGQDVAAALERAGRSMTLPVHRALLAFWREELLGDPANTDGWFAEYQKLLDAAGPNTEAEVRGRLLLARRARIAGDLSRANAALDAATACARAANNALWTSWIDEEAARGDAPAASQRLLLRFSGAAAERLRRTERVAATLVFADLVGFTARSNTMSPEEVMSTVRGLFEAATPVLAERSVQPLAYLGDGLLALALGDGHERRGATAAIELVKRSERISRARTLAGEAHGLMLRAGVASGPVVVGPLGNQLKLDFTAIGMPVNLAARLQSSAEPGQVVIERATAAAAALPTQRIEALTLKGVAQQTEVIRLTVNPHERS